MEDGMRVFDTYRFNIADKVKFKDTQPYLKKMLEELGFSWSDLAFSVKTVSSDPVIAKTLEKLPKLKKYCHSTKDGPTVCSYTENWFNGELFADKSDYDDIFTLFSKIPRPFKRQSVFRGKAHKIQGNRKIQKIKPKKVCGGFPEILI